MEPMLKCNFCFDVNTTLGTSCLVTLYLLVYRTNRASGKPILGGKDNLIIAEAAPTFRNLRAKYHSLLKLGKSEARLTKPMSALMSDL